MTGTTGLKRRSIGAFAAALLSLAAASGAVGAELPRATQAMLTYLKLEPSLMQGLDAELLVPAEMMDGARKEGTVKILGSWDPGQFTIMVAPFRERYPWLKLEYARGDFDNRALNPVIALQQGRYIADVITGFGGSDSYYRKTGALENLEPLPGFKNNLPGTNDPQGMWVGARLRYWCMSYNTSLVPADKLPKRWDDLLKEPEWRNGNLALVNRPQLWLLMVKQELGEEWGRNFLDKLFTEVKPQLRKEGANAMLALAIAGEFHASLPAADYRTKQYKDKGAPLSWHCPEPIPLAVSQMGILKGNPHPNAARLWVNWFLSKEGQVAQYRGDLATPIHRDLQIPAFVPFPEQIIGRKVAARVPDSLADIDKLNAEWMKYWTKGGGSATTGEQ
jgi:ABC-type Fe3+ transport system substrate-binding protein